MRKNLLSGRCLLVIPVTVCLAVLIPCSAMGPANSGAPAGQTAASQDAPAAAAITVENWSKPEPGWLYVLDAKPNQGPGERIWLLDPASGKSMGSIRAGAAADFALSPDGSRLYVASLAQKDAQGEAPDTSQGDASELAVIDTAEGKILKSGQVFSRALPGELPPFSTMAVSGDGSVLRILIDTPKSENADAYMLATFDTRADQFLPGIVHLGNCGPGRFISMPTADRVDFFCPRTNRVRLIRVDADSKETQNVDVTLPWERRVGAAVVIEVPGSESAAIVRGDGAVAEMNLPTQEFTTTAAHPDLPNRVPPAAWPTSPDGSKVFLGHNNEYNKPWDNRFYLDYGRPPNVRPSNSTVDQFRIFDTHTWRKIGTIRTKMPCWNAAISGDGKLLYAMSPEKHSILLIDTEKKDVIRRLKVDGAPALALVAP
jgi:hypothetical protein